MKGVGNGGVIQDGLFFIVDSFNVKSYIPPQTASYDMTERNHNCTLNNGVIFDGRSFEFDGIDDYIDVGNLGNDFASFTLDMWFNSSSVIDYKNIIDFNGGNTMLRIEQYTDPGYYYTYINLGGPAGYSRMTVSINPYGDGSFGIGGDCPGNIVENEWNNLIVSYQAAPASAIPVANIFNYDGFQMYRVSDGLYLPYTPIISGNHAAQWNNYIANSGGSINAYAYQSFGTNSTTYSVTSAVYHSIPNMGGYTFLMGADGSSGETMSLSCDIDNVYLGFNSIRVGGIFHILFNEYFNSWPSLTMSLSLGTYSETYIIDSATYDGTYSYLYDSSNIGTLYDVYTSWTALLPLTSTLGVIPPGLPPGGYDRIYATVSGNLCSIYLNSEKLIDQWIIPNGFIGYINNMRIGDGYDYSSRRFQGKIPYVALYNISLTPEECLNNYNSMKWRFNNL